MITVEAFDSDYHELNAGAHRITPRKITAPSVVWHLAMWTPTPEKRGKKDVKRDIDRYILDLSKSLKSKGCEPSLFPNVSDRIILFDMVAYPRSFIECRDPKLDRRQQDILDSGMRAVTLSFTWRSLDASLQIAFHTEYVTLTLLIELARGSTQIHDPDVERQTTRLINYLRSSNPSQYEPDLSNFFFFDFWKALMADLSLGQRLTDSSQISKNIFADFRGVILSEKVVHFDDDDFFEHDAPPIWGVAAKRMLLPLLKKHQSLRLRKYECAINYLLDGRALYLSTLAPQLPDATINERIPVQFVLFAHQNFDDKTTVVNGWQLGRLVSLIHQLGTVRLAGLRHVKLLREVGGDLSAIDGSLQEAREMADADGSGDVPEVIKNAHKKFNELSQKFYDRANTGISYRIERSRYYVKQFDLGKAILRIKRLEGDQPYDRFVERRLGAQYDFIDRLGRRYDRAVSSLLTIDQNYLAVKTAYLGKKATVIGNEIKNIQIWGEFVLFMALVPYYLSHLVDRLILSDYVPFATLGIWIASGTFAMTRKIGKIGLAISMLIIILLLFATIVIKQSDINCAKYLRVCLAHQAD